MILMTLAFAVPPDKISARIDVGMGEIDQLTMTSDGEALVGRSKGSDNFFVLSMETWEAFSPSSACTVTSVVPVFFEQGVNHIYAGCLDGTVERHVFAAGQLLPDILDSGAIASWDMAPDTTGSIDALFTDGFDLPFIFAYEDGPTGRFHVLDPATGLIDADVTVGYPMSSLYSGYVDSVSNLDSPTFAQGLGYLAHGGGRVSTLNLENQAVTFTPFTTGGLFDLDDIAPTLRDFSIWGVDTTANQLIQMDTNSGLESLRLTTLTGPKAVVANLIIGDEWLMIAGEGGVRIHQLLNGLITDPDMSFYDNADADIFIQDAVVAGQYTFGGGEAGKVAVITATPWIYDASVSPRSAGVGEAVTVTFKIDEAAEYEVRLNGSRLANALGDSLQTGSADADTEVSVEVVVDESWMEGDNTLYIFGVDGELRGHAVLIVAVDDVPGAPVLTADGVGVDEEALRLSFVGIEDEDLDHYLLYVSETEFSAGAVPTGFANIGDLSFPVRIEGVPGTEVSHSITPLENGVTYYIGVRAVDSGQKQSSMSNVVTGVPEDILNAWEMAGEKGGSSCSTSGSAGGWAFLVGLVALLGRRRAAAAALVLMAASAPAMADEKQKGDITKQYGNFEFRYGGFVDVKDETIDSVFGTGQNMLQMEFGPQITRFLEVDLQFGLYQELARSLTASGKPSARRTMLTQFPLGIAATGRLHIFDEQIIVPYVSLGLDYVLWNEISDNTEGGKDRISGSKMGNHWALGGGLLLDIFAPARASLLEAQTGINDTYITFEFRRQFIDSRKVPWGRLNSDGFNFSGSMFTMGLKLDY